MLMHTASPSDNDREVIERIRGGDIEAYEVLLNRYRGWVLAIVLKHVPPDRAEELAHVVFVEAYRALPGYRGAAEFRYWLAGIAVRQCSAFWRREARRPAVPASGLNDKARDWLDRAAQAEAGAAFERESDRRAAREVLDYALARLPAEDRTLMILLYIEDRSVREIARLSGWSPVNVKVRAFRIRRRLRQIIRQALQEEESDHAAPPR